MASFPKKKFQEKKISIYPSCMSGIIFFRFKHQKEFDKIEFPAGSEISIAELKLKIGEKLALAEKHANSSAIRLHRMSTTEEGVFGREYQEDHELIPSHSSVLVFRAPSKAGAKITVAQSDFFAPDQEGVDPLALQPSVIAGEQDQLKRLPLAVVCGVCNHLMHPPAHAPVVLHCCGEVVCAECGTGEVCPIEKKLRSPMRVTPHRGLARLVATVATHRNLFGWDRAILVPANFFLDQPNAPTSELPELEEEAIDLDEVVDVDREMSAAELAALERRERRKRKAAEWVLKKEGKAVKGELTEGEIARLFKQELKAEVKGEEWGEEAREAARGWTGPVVIEFPRLLTPDEFFHWQQSAQ